MQAHIHRLQARAFVIPTGGPARSGGAEWRNLGRVLQRGISRQRRLRSLAREEGLQVTGCRLKVEGCRLKVEGCRFDSGVRFSVLSVVKFTSNREDGPGC